MGSSSAESGPHGPCGSNDRSTLDLASPWAELGNRHMPPKASDDVNGEKSPKHLLS